MERKVENGAPEWMSVLVLAERIVLLPLAVALEVKFVVSGGKGRGSGGESVPVELDGAVAFSIRAQVR